jgi:hypothetical protein
VLASDVSEWVEWHRRYDSDAGLSGRLRLVQQMIRDALDARPAGSSAIISMCAGDGRDLLEVLASHPRRADVQARLVEADAELAGRARAEVTRLGLSVEVALTDASMTEAYAGAVPADVVLVCGVWGNVTDADVRNTVEHLPELCAPGATVIWTRGRFAPDLTPAIRGWFEQAGFTELAFATVPGSTQSAGAHRLVAAPRSFVPGRRLFTFLETELRPATIARRAAAPPQ